MTVTGSMTMLKPSALSTRLAVVAVLAAVTLAPVASALAQGAARGPSGLPLPRFVSLKAQKVNLRVGPGLDYAISWRYMRSGIPMEIIQEYDNWRRVRDAEGTEGWINQSLLSGERTAVAAPWMKDAGPETYVMLHSEPDERGRLVAKLQPGVIVNIEGCTGTWCEIDVDGAHGWLAQQEIWGAYPGEAFR
jgi:SH3-like domain-containing protein